MPTPAALRNGISAEVTMSLADGTGFRGHNDTVYTPLFGARQRAMYLREQTIAISGANHTLVIDTDASTNQTRMAGAIFLITSDAARDLTFPAASKLTNFYGMFRNTSAFNVTLKNSAGGSIGVLTPTMAAHVYCDGTTLRANLSSLTATSFALADNTAVAAQFAEGANPYQTFDTTNNAEKIDFAVPLTITYSTVRVAGFTGLTETYTLSDVAGGLGGVALVGEDMTCTFGVDRVATTGAMIGKRISLVGRAGDHSDARYFGLHVLTNGLGTGTGHRAIKVGPNFDAFMDLGDCLTGEADTILGANLASATAWRVAANDLLALVTTTNAWAADLNAGFDQDYSYTQAATLSDMAVTIDHATANLIGLNVHASAITTPRTGGTVTAGKFDLVGLATDNGGAYDALSLTMDKAGGTSTATGIRFDAGWDAVLDVSAMATGEADVVLGANLVSAFAWRVSTTDIMAITTATGAVGLNLDGLLDQDYTLAAAGTLSDMAGLFTHATDPGVAFNVHASQSVNARTAGTLTGVKIDMVGLAGDNGATYVAELLGITDNGGISTTIAHKYADGWDYVQDFSACATGKTNFLLATNKADAYTIMEGADIYYRINTTTKVASFLQQLTTTDGVASGDARKVGGMVYNRVADSATLDSAAAPVGPTAIDSYSIPANTIKAGTRVRFGGTAVVGLAGVGNNLTIDTILGAQVIATNVAAAAVLNNVVHFEGELIGRAAPGGAQAVVHKGEVYSAAASGASPANRYIGHAVANQATNGALTLAVRGTWAGGGVGDAVLIRDFWVSIEG